MSEPGSISPRSNLVAEPSSPAKGWFCEDIVGVDFVRTGTPENVIQWYELDLKMRTQAGRPEEELTVLRNEISRRRSALPGFPEKNHV